MTKAEIRKNWIAALRSGKYKQGRFRLFTRCDDTYCCLGVLTALAAQEGVASAEKYLENGVCLPHSVADWVGLCSTNGEFEKGHMSLIERNDNEGKTFAEIADIIESEPEGLFCDGGETK